MSEERKSNNNKEIAKIRSWGQKETTFQQQKNQKDKQQQGIEIIIETTIIKPEDQVQKLNPIHPSWPNSSNISERGTSMFKGHFQMKCFTIKGKVQLLGLCFSFYPPPETCKVDNDKMLLHGKILWDFTKCSFNEVF